MIFSRSEWQRPGGAGLRGMVLVGGLEDKGGLVSCGCGESGAEAPHSGDAIARLVKSGPVRRA